MVDVGVTWGFWFQFTPFSPKIEFPLALSWHEPLILVWLMLPSWCTGMGALSKGQLTGSIKIRTFSRCGFDIFLQELFCFLYWFYSFINLRLKSFPKKDRLFFFKTMSSLLSLHLPLNKAVNILCHLKHNPLLQHCPSSITHCSTNYNSILRSMTPSLWGDLHVPRGDPMVPVCWLNFPVPLSVTYLRRFFILLPSLFQQVVI